MGGAEAILSRARDDFNAGEYRWVVQVSQQVVFADPAHRGARELAADAMEQLAYQSESATWRNAYLLGAKELRFGAPKPPPGGAGAISPKVVAMMPMPMFFDFLAVRVNAEKVAGVVSRIDWKMTDENQCYRLTLSHCALNHSPGTHGAMADAVISVDRGKLAAFVAAGMPFLDSIDDNRIQVTGDKEVVRHLFASFDSFYPMFNIVEP